MGRDHGAQATLWGMQVQLQAGCFFWYMRVVRFVLQEILTVETVESVECCRFSIVLDVLDEVKPGVLNW